MTKTFIPLENNPEVMNTLAQELGLSPKLKFIDIYSLTDADQLAFIPRPVHALIFIYPGTPALHAFYDFEQATHPTYTTPQSPPSANAPATNTAANAPAPTLWFPQTINHACGLHGLLHSTLTPASVKPHITPNSTLSTLQTAAAPLSPQARTELLESSDALESAHATAAQLGSTTAPPLGEDPDHAFITFVRGSDGHLWEMEGRGKGPLDLGPLAEDEDVLSPSAVERGPLRYIQKEIEATLGGADGQEAVVRFSCTALVDDD